MDESNSPIQAIKRGFVKQVMSEKSLRKSEKEVKYPREEEQDSVNTER